MIITLIKENSSTSEEYFKKQAAGKKLPCLDRPCADCAITTGFYIPIADELLTVCEELQDQVAETWFCHNHTDKACRGIRNYLDVKRKKS